ncbi:hypothetical protein Patl1_24552 [Pistacia atlantica]|uniref:Uncharacterized protein n=1 Tax=Pistacia atlantica TaxID=434234 RepID=A0ACC0ZZS5_9ROSI|nr:hypothetical protein Patl1_24552 [Pistacia atlantica]
MAKLEGGKEEKILLGPFSNFLSELRDKSIKKKKLIKSKNYGELVYDARPQGRRFSGSAVPEENPYGQGNPVLRQPPVSLSLAFLKLHPRRRACSWAISWDFRGFSICLVVSYAFQFCHWGKYRGPVVGIKVVYFVIVAKLILIRLMVNDLTILFLGAFVGSLIGFKSMKKSSLELSCQTNVNGTQFSLVMVKSVLTLQRLDKGPSYTCSVDLINVQVAPLLARSNLLITRDTEWANLVLGFDQVHRPFWWTTSSIYAGINSKEIGVVHGGWHVWRRVYDLYLG